MDLGIRLGRLSGHEGILGSNGYRPRLWKYGLYQTIARVYGLIITVCHYPPGASKWNPVEHRLFSFISPEWAGHPLRSLQLMMSYIEGTTTKTGLQVKAFLHGRQYVKGKTVPDELFKTMETNVLRQRIY